MNKYLAFRRGSSWRTRRPRPIGYDQSASPSLPSKVQLAPQQHAATSFIAEQIGKCDRKLRDEDYDGAITNATLSRGGRPE